MPNKKLKACDYHEAQDQYDPNCIHCNNDLRKPNQDLKHAPWRSKGPDIFDANKKLVAKVCLENVFDPDFSDAQFIVQAVNCHIELVQALKEIKALSFNNKNIFEIVTEALSNATIKGE